MSYRISIDYYQRAVLKVKKRMEDQTASTLSSMIFSGMFSANNFFEGNECNSNPFFINFDLGPVSETRGSTVLRIPGDF